MDERMDEQKLKAMAEQQEQQATNRCKQGSVRTGLGGMTIAEPSLRERIASQRFRAETESRRASQLVELEYLLDKHPEVARILDLMESVRS